MGHVLVHAQLNSSPSSREESARRRAKRERRERACTLVACPACGAAAGVECDHPQRLKKYDYHRAQLKSPSNPLRVACPGCASAAWVPCKDSNGSHRARIARAHLEAGLPLSVHSQRALG